MQYWVDTAVFAGIGVMGLIASVLMFIAAGMDGNVEWAVFLRVVGGIGLFISVAMQMRAVARILSRPEPTAEP
jgi:membrane-bound ClpP family serine protease